MRKTLVAAILAANCHTASAIEPFTPLTASATLVNTNENAGPFLLPAGWLQQKIVDVAALNALFGGAYPIAFRAFDQLAIGGASSQLIYIPHEVSAGAGVTRYDRATNSATILIQGNSSVVFDLNPADGWSHLSDDFGAFDPAVLTPDNHLLVAEEWSGAGRIFELLNPESATGPGDANWRWLAKIPAVAHEGLKVDTAGNLYFGDEWNSGSIYKFVPKVAGDRSVGQTFVLRDNDGAHNAAANYNVAPNNVVANRTGDATWVAMTDIDGNPMTVQNPFIYSFTQGARGGVLAADELGGTPFGRPEDMEIGALANGHEVLYFSATSEQAVYSIELDPNGDGNTSDAFVRVFAQGGVTVNSGGNVVPSGAMTTYGLGAPDNLEIDPAGQVFIVEDQNPGDIWVATDADGNGMAEKIDLWASLGPFGSEPSGLRKDALGGFLVSVQHPSSSNDAVWSLLPDSDLDGVANKYDNCSRSANPTQLDADSDGYGNHCDADLNNSGTVTTADFGLLRSVLGQPASASALAAAADINGSGTVTTADFGLLRARLGTAPGPARTTE